MPVSRSDLYKWIQLGVIALITVAIIYFLVQYVRGNNQSVATARQESFRSSGQNSGLQEHFANLNEDDGNANLGASYTGGNVSMASPQQDAYNVRSNPNVAPEPALQPMGQNESFKPLNAKNQWAYGDRDRLPKDCFPKDQLTPAELLPGDANSTWAQVNPIGQGDLMDKNFLEAGYHIGINTVGQSNRNANLQLRSEPPNPQMSVSPWMQSTIEPDLSRKPLEIGN